MNMNMSTPRSDMKIDTPVNKQALNNRYRNVYSHLPSNRKPHSFRLKMFLGFDMHGQRRASCCHALDMTAENTSVGTIVGWAYTHNTHSQLSRSDTAHVDVFVCLYKIIWLEVKLVQFEKNCHPNGVDYVYAFVLFSVFYFFPSFRYWT